MRILVIIFYIFYNVSLYSQYAIIPEPVSIQYDDMMFLFENKVILSCGDGLTNECNQLKEQLTQGGYIFVDKKTPRTIQIDLRITDKKLAKEGYELNVTKSGISVNADMNVGIFRGSQTILQMMPIKAKPTFSLRACRIEDYPQYGWRGLMFDVSRHFFSIADVKKFIDVMAEYKFNTFHWHLTDDEGWRIEIKSLPELTAKASFRAERYGAFGTRSKPTMDEAKPYGGFYTHDEIREIIRYASDKHITIVPEIDVPGHSMALLAAFPELSTKKEPTIVSSGFKFSEWYANGTFKMLIENTLNPSDEKVYEVLDKIFTEVAALFPGEFIHVGGDECYHGFWEADENCKKLIKEKNLKDGMGLQSYFMKRVSSIITSKKKKMIGWDEILYGGLAEGAAVMSWRGMEGGIKAASMGHEVVMSPTSHCYLDYSQGDHTLEFPIYADLYLKKTYSFNPLPSGINKSLILGGQGNLWTEQIPTLDHAFYMTYPRAFALSESLWSGENKKNWDIFASKVEAHFDRFEAKDLSIAKTMFEPIIKPFIINNFLQCSLLCETPNTEIRYTFDNTFPTKKSPLFNGSFTLPEGIYSLKAATFRDGKQLGRTISVSREELLKRAEKK